MTPEERRARSARFRALMESGEVQELLDEIEAQFVAEWKVAATSDERENCHRTVRIIGVMRQRMASIAAGEPGEATALRRLK